MPVIEIDFSRFTLRKDLPAHRQVAAYLKALIAIGHLSPGDSVPGAPALAYRLHVPPAEVRKAYAELAGRGFLNSDGGKWSVSDDHFATGDLDAANDICDRLWDLVVEARRAGLSRTELERMFKALLVRC